MKYLFMFVYIGSLFAYEVSFTNIDNSLSTKAARNTSALLEAFIQADNKTSKLNLKNVAMTSTGKNRVIELFKGTSIFPTGDSHRTKFLKMQVAGTWQVRDIPVIMKSGDSTFKRNIAIDLRSGKIIDIKVTMDQHNYESIINNKSNPVGSTRKLQIVLDFVENFRTAYNRKDVQYLEKVFNDKALIITGHVLKLKTNSDQLTPSKQSGVQLYIKTKKEYIKNLKSVFKKNEYIKVGFDSIKVSQAPVDSLKDWYGVQLIQNFESSRYSDRGHVFLLMDMKNEHRPEIWVRSWQPTKDTKSTEVLDIGFFEF